VAKSENPKADGDVTRGASVEQIRNRDRRGGDLHDFGQERTELGFNQIRHADAGIELRVGQVKGCVYWWTAIVGPVSTESPAAPPSLDAPVKIHRVGHCVGASLGRGVKLQNASGERLERVNIIGTREGFHAVQRGPSLVMAPAIKKFVVIPAAKLFSARTPERPQSANKF